MVVWRLWGDVWQIDTFEDFLIGKIVSILVILGFLAAISAVWLVIWGTYRIFKLAFTHPPIGLPVLMAYLALLGLVGYSAVRSSTEPAGALAASAAAQTTEFTPYWVQNYQPTGMWSGPAGQEGVVNFGTTSAEFCAFEVVRPQSNSRLYVFNPYSNNYFWIDADAVITGGPPVNNTGPKPAGQNCLQEASKN